MTTSTSYGIFKTKYDIYQRGNFSYCFDRAPLDDSFSNQIEQLLNKAISCPSKPWGKKFNQAVDRVQQANQNLAAALDQLDNLRTQVPPEDLEKRHIYLENIRSFNHTVRLKITSLYECIRIAQNVRHEKPLDIFLDRQMATAIDRVNDLYLKPLKNDWIGRYMQYAAEIEEATNKAIYLNQAYRHYVCKLPEFNRINEGIYTTESDTSQRALLIESLRKVRDEIHQSKQKTLEIFPDLSIDERTIFEDFTDITEKSCESLFSQARFYADHLADNATQINGFKRDNRLEDYHRYSALFAEKLIREADAETGIKYSTEWMKNTDTNTSPESVLFIGNAHLRGLHKQSQSRSGKNETPNTVDPSFYDAFTKWLETRTDLQLTPEVIKSRHPSKERSQSEELLLMRGYLALSQQKEPSHQELTCYQMCDQLDPAFHWKAKEGEFYLSCIKFEDSRKLIARLPEENSHYLKQLHSWTQYRCACVALEVATLTLQLGAHFFPKGKIKKGFEHSSSLIQILSNPLIAKYSIPKISRATIKFIDYEEELAKHPYFSTDEFPWLEIYYLTKLVVPPIARCLPIRMQERLNLNTAIPALNDGMMTFGALTADMSKVSLWTTCSTVTQAAVSAISLACLVHQGVNKKRNPSIRALQETTSEISSLFLPINLIGGGVKHLAAWAAKRFAPSIVPGLGTVLIGFEAVQSGVQIAVVIHEGSMQYPLRKQAQFLIDIQNYWLTGDYRRGKTLLQKSILDSNLSQDFAEKFLDSLDFFKIFHHLENTEQSRAKLDAEIKKLNKVIKTLKRFTGYNSAYNAILTTKARALIKTGKEQNILLGDALSDPVIEQLFSSLISEIKSFLDQGDYNKAIARLEMLSRVDIFEKYKSILEKYKNYVILRQNTQRVTQETPPNIFFSLIDALNILITETNNVISCSECTDLFEEEKIALYISAKKYKEANELLDSWKTSQKLYNRTIERLVNPALAIAEGGDHRQAAARIREISLGLRNQKMSFLVFVTNFFIHKGRYLQPNSTQEVKAGYLNALNNVINASSTDLPLLNQRFRLEKALFYIKTRTALTVTRFLKKQEDPLDDHLALYYFSETMLLCRNGKFVEAIALLDFGALIEFEHKALIETYRDYVLLYKEYQNPIPHERRDADRFIEVLIKLINHIPEAESFYNIQLHFERLLLYSYIAARKYKEAKDLINASQNRLIHFASSYISEKIFNLIDQKKHAFALELIEIGEEMLPSQRAFFINQRNHANLCFARNSTLPSSLEETEDFIRVIDPILAETPQTECFDFFRSTFKQKKLYSLLIGKRYRELNELIRNEDSVYQDLCAVFILERADLLNKQNRSEESKQFIQECSKLIEFNHTELLMRYTSYLNRRKFQNDSRPNQQSIREDFLKAIDLVLDAMPKIDRAKQQTSQLKFWKLITYIELQNFKSAKELLEDERFTNEVKEALLFHILVRAENKRTSGGVENSFQYIEQVSRALGLEREPKIDKYKKFVRSFDNFSSISMSGDAEDALEILRAIKQLKDEFRETSSMPASVKMTETDLFCKLAQFNVDRRNLPEAISLFETAIKCLPDGQEEAIRNLSQFILQLKTELQASRRSL